MPIAKEEKKTGEGWGAPLKGGVGVLEQVICEHGLEGEELPGTFEEQQRGPLGGAQGGSGG